MLKFEVILVACILQVIISANCEHTGYYSVIGPGTIRSNSDYDVTVTVFDDVLSEIKVGLVGPKFSESKTVQVKPFSNEILSFKIPKLTSGDYNLTAEGTKGIIFTNSTSLNFEEKYFNVYIQTDKATYKPGDLVRFRVLVLDPNTKPLKETNDMEIYITDTSQDRIKQYKNIELTKGVFTGELQLSKFPVLGDWQINVKVDGQTFDKKFEIAKYVLPKFDVQIDTASDVYVKDNIIRATIRSKYTYGKPVKGTAKVSLGFKRYSYYYSPDRNTRSNITEKTIPIDGKGIVEFDLIKDLKIDGNLNSYYVPPLEILAVVEEELTGLKQNATKSISMHNEKYKFTSLPSNPWRFSYDKPLIYKISVKTFDDIPVQDDKNPLTLEVLDNSRTIMYSPEENKVREPVVSQKLQSQLDSNGIAQFEILIPKETNNSYFSLRANYRDQNSYIGSISREEPRTGDYLNLETMTEKPTLKNDVTMQISSNHNIPTFSYVIVGRGNILQTGKVEVNDKETTKTFSFTPTFSMVPSAKVFIYFVREGLLNFESATVDFENELENFIDIEVPSESKPGADVDIKVRTTPESFVGLLGVDQSVLLLKSGNDIAKDSVIQDLRQFDSRTPWMRGFGKYPGQDAGLVTLTNAHYAYDERHMVLYSLASGAIGPGASISFQGMRGPGIPSPESGFGGSGNVGNIVITERKLFPETWIWLSENDNTNNGEFTIHKKVPDTITSWVLTGFSINPTNGLGLTNSQQKLKVFQPLFLSTNTPYSVKRGEMVAIPVIVFNYMDKNLDAEIEFDNSAKEFEFAEATNEVDEKTSDEIVRMKRVTVPSNSAKSVSFMIRPKNVGHVTIKLKAITPLAGDAIEQILLVEPDGVTQYVNKPLFIVLKDQHESMEKIDIDIPKDVVPNSEYIEVSVVGDILGPTIQNLDKLVRMPYGCGEQNMVNFVPNILVLKYLKNVGGLTPSIESKAKGFLEVGYQRELTYKHDDGSYSAFGKSDGNGSTWLTAYVMRSFHEAKPYIDIDEKIIENGLEFLAKTQSEDGRFPEYGKVIDKAHSGDSEDGLALTAFVLLAFIENKESRPKYESNIQSAMEYLKKNIDETTDLYTLTIVTYAMKLADDKISEKLTGKLNSLAKVNGDRKWWAKEAEKKDPKKSENLYFYHLAKSNDVEMTSYALLAMITNDNVEEILPIIKWLISQRNSNGGFGSTQDTVVGLTALINFAQKYSTGKADVMNIEFSDDVGTKHSIPINHDNSWVLQSYVLPTTAKKVSINARGNGSALVQVSYRYNIVTKPEKPSFNIKTNIEKSPSNLLKLEACFNYIPSDDDDNSKESVESVESVESNEKDSKTPKVDDKKKGQSENDVSNMAVAEINLPSGYTADLSDDSLTELQRTDRVKRVETKNQDTVIVVYFDDLDKDVVCTPIVATRTSAVAKQKPVAIEVYDYYNPKKRGITYYTVNSSLCDICSDDECGTGCQKK